MTQEQQPDDTFAIRNRIDENWRRRTPQRIAALKAGEPTPPATPQPETMCGTCGKPASDGDTYVQCGPCHWRALSPPPDVERLTRPETGPMQFGDDWPGVFVRGDNAGGIVATLMSVVALVEQTRPMEAVQLRSIMRLFDSSDVRKKPEVQRAVLLSSTPGEPR